MASYIFNGAGRGEDNRIGVLLSPLFSAPNSIQKIFINSSKMSKR